MLLNALRKSDAEIFPCHLVGSNHREIIMSFTNAGLMSLRACAACVCVLFTTLFTGCSSLNLATPASLPTQLPIQKLTNSKTVALGKIVSTIPADKLIGRTYTSTVNGPFTGGYINALLPGLMEVCAAELQRNGVKILGLEKNNLFSSSTTDSEAAELKLAVVVTDYAHILEELVLELGNTQCQSRVTVEWHLFDVSREKEIFVCTTEGYAKTKGYEYNASHSRAFAVAANNLMANPDFVKMLAKTP